MTHVEQITDAAGGKGMPASLPGEALGGHGVLPQAGEIHGGMRLLAGTLRRGAAADLPIPG